MMKLSTTNLLLALIALAAFALPAYADEAAVLRATQDGRTAQVILRLKSPAARPWENAASVSEQKELVERAYSAAVPGFDKIGVDVTAKFATLPFVGVSVTREQALKLLDDPSIDGMFVNTKERKAQTVAVDTPETAKLASSVPSIDVADAWSRGYDGTGTLVAVIDGGFRTTHPMFAGKNVLETCFSANDPTFDTYTQCPGGTTPLFAAGAASNCPAGSTRCDHGTHVASIAAGNDGTNFGVARGAKMVLVDVFSEVRSASDCSPDPAPCELTDRLTVLKALDWLNTIAGQVNLAAINLSLGGSSSEGFCDTDPRAEVIQMLRAKGVAVVAATGNEAQSTKINAPSCIAASVAVGATNDALAVASFTNISSSTDLLAPGSSVRAASGQNDGFVTRSGTSMATPHAAGAFAILRQAAPGKSVNELEQALKSSGVKTSRTGVDLILPKIQVNRAILRLQGRDKRVFNNVLTSNRASTLGEAYLRFQNNSITTAGAVNVALRDAATGLTLATWASPAIAPHASVQFDVAVLEREARAMQGAVIGDVNRSYYNLEVESSVPGYMQHIVWARGVGVLTNLTACADGLSDDTRSLMNVHSRAIDGYPSRIRIANTGAATEAAVLTFYNSANGRLLGTYTTAPIPPSGSLEVSVAGIEAAVPTLLDPNVTGVNAIYQYNVELGGLTGYLQHIVENQRSGVLLDMSPKCDLGVR